MNIVLMAGGGGTRLWPLSRQAKPKQFIDLGSGQTLLEHAYGRACAVVPANNVYVATAAAYEEQVKKLLPAVPADHFFLEPARRDTAPAFATVALQLIDRGLGDEPTMFMWSDHIFTNEAQFLDDVRRIPELLAAHPETIVIIGHTPTAPETGLGYIEAGEPLAGHHDVFRVTAFKEKPNQATAEQYLADGRYFWNLAYVSCTPAYLAAQLKEFEPELMNKAHTYTHAVANGSDAAAQYEAMPKLAIDYALLERTPRLLVITGDYGWSDVGNWGTVHDIFGLTGDYMPRGHHVHVDSADNYVYNATDRAVSLIGLKNTIVVVTDDAILVTSKDQAHRVREVVQKLETDDKGEYL